MASAWTSSRSPTSASGGVRTTSTCTSVQRAAGRAVDDADAAPGHARVDTEYAHGTPPVRPGVERSFDQPTTLGAARAPPRQHADAAAPGRQRGPYRAPMSVHHLGQAAAASCVRARCSWPSWLLTALGGVLAWHETAPRLAARRLRRAAVRARRLDRLGLPPRVRARLRRLPRRRPQRRGRGLPDPQPVQVHAPGAVDPAAAVLHRAGRHRPARRCGLPAPARVPQPGDAERGLRGGPLVNARARRSCCCRWRSRTCPTSACSWPAATSTPGSGAASRSSASCRSTAAVLNLLPVPGLDGWAIIEPYLDPENQRLATRSSPGACSA